MKKSLDVLKKSLMHIFEEDFLDGLTEDQLIDLVKKHISKEDVKKKYHRTLDIIESRAMTVKAYGYLMNMYNINSIDDVSLEKILQLCLHLYFNTDQPVSKLKMDKIITMVNFAEVDQASMKDFIETLLTDNGKNINSIFKYEH